MKIVKTINFKTLRDEGPAAIDLKDDEVIQVVSRGTHIKCIVTQEYLLKLETAYNSILIHAGLKKEVIVDGTAIDIEKMTAKFKEISDKANES